MRGGFFTKFAALAHGAASASHEFGGTEKRKTDKKREGNKKNLEDIFVRSEKNPWPP